VIDDFRPNDCGCALSASSEWVVWAEKEGQEKTSTWLGYGGSGRKDAMTFKRIAASVVIGLLTWFVLMVFHEEWRLPINTEAFGPPPFNPFRPWVPLVLIAMVWWALNTFLRWAYRPEHFPQGR
jgi:hypothetical protein